jgi:hypothetical protein
MRIPSSLSDPVTATPAAIHAAGIKTTGPNSRILLSISTYAVANGITHTVPEHAYACFNAVPLPPAGVVDRTPDELVAAAEDIGLGDNEQGGGLLDARAALLGSDSAPRVSWVNPSDSETVSGTITDQIDAADSEASDDSLDVTYTVDGGSTQSTTYNALSGYYGDSWDTTGVSDGDHTLAATATDSATSDDGSGDRLPSTRW